MAKKDETVKVPEWIEKHGYQPIMPEGLKPQDLKPPKGGPAIEPPKPQATTQPPPAPPAKK